MSRLLLAATAAALALAGAPAAHADTQDLSASLGQWAAFDVDPMAAADGGAGWIDLSGDALSFSFTVTQAVQVTVVDAGFAGDVFQLSLDGHDIGTTSATTASNYPTSVGLDFDAALADAGYSRRTLTLGPGSYTLTGSLFRSALDDAGLPLDATVGGVLIQAAPVPEPASGLMLLAGLGALAGALRRRVR